MLDKDITQVPEMMQGRETHRRFKALETIEQLLENALGRQSSYASASEKMSYFNHVEQDAIRAKGGTIESAQRYLAKFASSSTLTLAI